jgi:DNA-3-methyladenine glycosylase I
MNNQSPITNHDQFRCEWAGIDPLMIAYHDTEWGVPLHSDQELFEFLILEGMQAGLSWMTILRKRENFRTAFDGFDPGKVAQYDQAKFEQLMGNAGIIRNRRKIESATQNAQAFLAVQEEFGSLPAQTEESITLSKDLKKRGFNFVGPTIVYAHMQATGMVNDHTTDCFRYREVQVE